MKDKIRSLYLGEFVVRDINALDEYLNFCLDNRYDGDEYKESHHILLQACFPEFVKDDWNLVYLRYQDHIKAHELLAKAISNNKINGAHFFMKATSGQLDEKLREWNASRFVGDNNPAKRPEVRKKISDSKIGKVRADMVGSRYFGASEETIKAISDKSSKFHMGTVPVRLPDGSVIKIKKTDPRYISGELRCIIGAKKGQIGPNADPEVKARFKQTLEARKQKFSTMTGEEIAMYCQQKESEGKIVFKAGKLTSNFGRLFGFANLNPDDFIHLIH